MIKSPHFDSFFMLPTVKIQSNPTRNWIELQESLTSGVDNNYLIFQSVYTVIREEIEPLNILCNII